MQRKLIAALTITTALIAAPALAQEKGDFTIGLGIGYVMPKDDNGTLDNGFEIEVGNNARPTLTFEYFIADNLGIEILAAWPFTHTIDVGGVGEVGETTHLPPTLSLIYHFDTKSAWSPYVGAGINYTWFYDTDLNATGAGALGGSQALKLDNSWGLAAVLGIDYAISDTGAIRGEVRYIDIDTDASVNGTDVGTVEVDPFVFNVAYVFKF